RTVNGDGMCRVVGNEYFPTIRVHSNGGRPIQTSFRTLDHTKRRHIAAGVFAIDRNRRRFESAGTGNIVVAADRPKRMSESRTSASLPFIDRSPIGDVNQTGFGIDRYAVRVRHPRLGSLQQTHWTLEVLRVFLKRHDGVVVLDGQ